MEVSIFCGTKRAQERAGATSSACACGLCLLNHRFHRLSVCNAAPYRIFRACMSDEEYQIGDT